MKRKAIYLIIILSLFNPISSFCQEPQEINQANENFAGDCAECAAYYNMVYYAIKDKAPEGAASYEELMDSALKLSALASTKGRTPEMAVDVAFARFGMYKKQMRKEADNDNANISILINKYHFRCSEIMENPEKYLSTLNKKTDNK